MSNTKQPLPHPLKLLLSVVLLPIIILIFYIVAPYWLNSSLKERVIHQIGGDSGLSLSEKARQVHFYENIDFKEISKSHLAEYEDIRLNLEKSGIITRFEMLEYGLFMAIFLNGFVFLTVILIYFLNKSAVQSQDHLISAYRWGWRISIFGAVLQILTLIPLLVYGIYEFSILLTTFYFPKLLFMIGIGGIIAIWGSIKALSFKVPLEFTEKLSRRVLPEEAPILWNTVKDLACKLQTDPPDNIVIGLGLNFYVTELDVKTEEEKVKGRTLYLSLPLLQFLSEKEVTSIIGHELAHFLGKDTRITREFYPLKYKIHVVMFTLAHVGWMGWMGLKFFNWFHLIFSEIENTISREREFLADKVAAESTSASTFSKALIRVHMGGEVLQRELTLAFNGENKNPFEKPASQLIQEKFSNKPEFWRDLFEMHLPHPLDSHPTLIARIQALGQSKTEIDFHSLIHNGETTAFEAWFNQGDDLFHKIHLEMQDEIQKAHSKFQAGYADYSTKEGSVILDQCFPLQKWQRKSGHFWLRISFFAIIFFLAFCSMWSSSSESLLISIPAQLLCGVWIYMNWIRHRKSILTLKSNEIEYDGWVRKINFSDVDNIIGQNISGKIRITFLLKEKQLPLWKFSVFKIKSRKQILDIEGFDKNSTQIGETILRYYNRQA